MAVNVPDAGSPLVDANGLITPAWYPVIRLLIDQANTAETDLQTIADADPDLPLTTLGDIIVHNGTSNARLPIGTTGQVPTVVGGTLAYATPSVDVVAIEAGAVTAAATLDIDLSAEYDMYEIDLINLLTDSGNQILRMRFSQSGSFLSGASDYFWAYQSAGVAATDEADSEFEINSASDGTGEGLTMTVRVFRPGAASFQKSATWAGFGRTTTPTSFAISGGGGLAANTDAIDGVRFLFASGNIATGYYAVRAYRFT